MRFGKYFKDRLYLLFIAVGMLIVSVLIMLAFKVKIEVVVTVGVLFVLFYVLEILTDFFRKKRYYDELLNNIDNLDKKYLVLETLSEPYFYEGRILNDVLHDVDKSMADNINIYRRGAESFKEYVEMWIHEIKLPISSLTLMLHNYKDREVTERMNIQVNRINSYIEQILYYVRSENAEKDYIIDDCQLSKVIAGVAMKNKDDILENKISFQVADTDKIILTDAKWLEFMMNQIISNSIKYKDKSKCEGEDGTECVIRVSAEEDDKSVVLSIYDNGIGISESDLPRVFDKSFTGQNGREYSKATGMGLYIVKKLCDKMGHGISIESVKGEYTLVKIVFYKNDFYKEIV